MLLGDYIHGKLVAKLTSCYTDLYAHGYLSTDEFNTLLQQGIDHMKSLREDIDENVAMSVMDPYDMYYMERGGAPEVTGSAPPVEINVEIPTLQEPTEDSEKGGTTAGPDEDPPTDETRKNELLERLETLNFEIGESNA